MVRRHPETLAATALGHDDAATGAIIPPLHPSTTYLRDDDNRYSRGRMYARADNPTFDAAANTLTALEEGAATLLFSDSGEFGRSARSMPSERLLRN